MKKKITLLFFLIVTFLILNYNYYENFISKIKKKKLNTEILIPSNISIQKENLEDFKKRFENHELKTNTKLRDLIKNIKNQDVLDAGAHVGDTGIFMAKYLKDIDKKGVKIIMVEPDKLKVDLINQLIKLNNLEDYTEVYNYALGKKYSKGKIIKKKHSGAWNIKECSDKECNIEINSIDNLFNNRNIGLIHLDVEGFEYEVLQGCINLLKKYKPKIIIEVILSDKKKLHNLLTKYKYKFKEILQWDYFYE